MANVFDDVRYIRNRAKGDNVLLPGEARALQPAQSAHPLDSEENRKLLRKLLEWYYYEREKQAPWRMEMAMDCDFYDGIQWSQDDALEVASRGQMPLVYNEIAPMVDWLIGTERRNRPDWNVLPRSDDDVVAAGVKTKVLKYLSDVNKVPFSRSRAFADAIKAGIGWLDTGVRDDPTKETVYHGTERWRNVLHDSSSDLLDYSDARYLFRWRWVDEDIAIMMFPDRRDVIEAAVQDYQHQGSFEGFDDDEWQSGYEATNGAVLTGRGGQLFASGSASVDARRRRVKLIECQYKMPVRTKIVAGGPLKGLYFDERDEALVQAVVRSGAGIIDRVTMRMHVAVFTESHLLSNGPSIFRHNDFSLTPIFCYRRDKDRAPYGVIRRGRDIQQDLNKRASKALFLLNTNQMLYEKNAIDDVHRTRDEVDRPDGNIEVKNLDKFTIRRDTEMATGQIQMMQMAAASIQKTAGVTDENLGRRTNAVSGRAIEARQTQGSVVTTEPFDNLLLATQVDGQKLLSVAEQFMTEERVIRLTGEKNKIEWVKINQPVQDPDGTIRYLNDMSGSAADFIVAERDYAGSLRQVMFDSINALAQRTDPVLAMKLMIIAMDYSDLPNKDEIVAEMRRSMGIPDPNGPQTDEEAQQQEQARMMQLEQIENQRMQARQAMEEQQAKIDKIRAETQEIMRRAAQNGNTQADQAMLDMHRKMADEIEKVSSELRKAQVELANRTLEIKSKSDTDVRVAQINADSREMVAQIQQQSDARLKKMEETVNAMLQRSEQAAQITAQASPAPAENTAPVPPINVNVQVQMPKAGSKQVQIRKNNDGTLTGEVVSGEDGVEQDNNGPDNNSAQSGGEQ
ncbi:MAG TPA: hypothetical protein VFV57_05880 [Limnobacter sp.]|nr:hypothetical protein [Limnobacter sp.]